MNMRLSHDANRVCGADTATLRPPRITASIAFHVVGVTLDTVGLIDKFVNVDTIAASIATNDILQLLGKYASKIFTRTQTMRPYA